MSRSESVIDIPIRLEEPGRFFIFEPDEIPVVIIPFFIGLLTQNMIPGIIFAVLSYFGWTRIKGEKGFYGLHAMRYWFFPKSITYLPSFPDSAVSHWSA